MSSDYFWVCFREADRPLWFMRFLKKGFSHCFAIGISHGLYVKYESGHGVTRVDVSRDYKQWVKGCIMVKVKAGRSNPIIFLNTCVGFVKAVCGIDSKAVTPYQLYRAINNGLIQ